VAVKAESGAGTDEPLPETYVDLRDQPARIHLRTISTLLDIHTRVSDLYSSPHDQIAQQLRLTIETIKERQNPNWSTARYGCWPRRPRSRRFRRRRCATPDDLDALITKVWKTRASPDASAGVAAFGREAPTAACHPLS